MKDFAFGKENFLLIIAAIVFLITGFALMSGGGASDSVSFSNKLFDTQRIAVAPFMTVIGFALVIVGILIKPKDKAPEEPVKKA
ncbi:MAG: DUF3098 domain-containing protein [Tannerella sp.]|jgi:uncharacterized membrane protein|nr:DUF3098 domain-containing protein [Tannerella sp.]